MKYILITGANSYIGTSFEEYIKKWAEQYAVTTIDMIDGTWKKKDFTKYDVVFHVAGIVHSDKGKIPKEKENLYYKINTELTEAVALKAKMEGVNQFIYMSSMSVYGDSAPIGECKIITKNTKPQPVNAYGDSKLQAEKKIQLLNNDEFKVVILRPPIIYGKESKGNYPILSKYAKKTPIFPLINNQRSMLYIENLCEFIRLVIDNSENGVFNPQNKEYVNTCELVQMISLASKHNIKMIGMFNGIIKCFSGIVPQINKVFGGYVYDLEMSKYKFEYQLVSFEESIKRTESE